jgi:hypothetical protein
MFDIDQARHEIDERNRIRVVAKLPPVSVAAELRRLYEVHRQNEFEQFFRSSPLRQRVECFVNRRLTLFIQDNPIILTEPMLH